MDLNFKYMVFGDTETTGTKEEDRIIENAYIKFNGRGQMEYLEELCKAPLPIKPQAAAIHGYRNAQVADKPGFDTTKGAKELKKLGKEGKYYYVAHNAPFDVGMLAKEGVLFAPDRVIDTLNIARHLYRDDERVEAYGLQYFRYLFEFDDQPYFQEGMRLLGLTEIRPHTALSDIYILWLFAAKLREDFNLSIEDMVLLSMTPAEEKYLDFGNVLPKGELTYDEVVTATYHQYGKKKVGYDYLDWAINNMENMRLDRMFAIKKAMAYGILNQKIPFKSGFEGYLFWGATMVFDQYEARRAFEMLGTAASQADIANRFISQSQNNLSRVEGNEKKDLISLINYVKYIRLPEM